MASAAGVELDTDTSKHPAHFFRQTAFRIAQHSLAQVKICDDSLPESIRIQALHILNYALPLDVHWPLVQELLLLLADKLEQSGYREDWLPLLECALPISQQHHDCKSTAEIHLHIGYLLQLSGNLEAAGTHYRTSATAFMEVGLPARCARVLNRFAHAAWQQRKRPQALQLVNEALQLVDNNHPERANALLMCGWLAFDERNWQESSDCFAEAITILQTSGTRYQLACGLRDRAAPLHMLTRDSEAIDCLQQATILFAQLGNRFQQAVVSMNEGIIYLARQQITPALERFHAAEPIFRQLHDLEHLSKLYLNQALAYRSNHDLAKSVVFLQSSIELFEQIGNVDWLANAKDELGLTLLQMGNVQQAIVSFQDALTLLSATQETSTYRRSQLLAHLESALQLPVQQADSDNL